MACQAVTSWPVSVWPSAAVSFVASCAGSSPANALRLSIDAQQRLANRLGQAHEREQRRLLDQPVEVDPEPESEHRRIYSSFPRVFMAITATFAALQVH